MKRLKKKPTIVTKPSTILRSRINDGTTKEGKIIAMSMQRSAPLPPPQEIEHYNKMIPNAGIRFMKMVERRVYHSITLEYLKYLLGAGVSLLFLWVGYLLAINGHEIVAVVLYGGGSLGVVFNFLIALLKKNDR